MKSVPYVMNHWIMSIAQWKSGTSKDHCVVNVTQKKSMNSIQELMKE
jgi:hypothetical protein